MKIAMRIVRICDRYMVVTDGGTLHVLNERSLKWNLKHVFRFSPLAVAEAVRILKEEGEVGIAA